MIFVSEQGKSLARELLADGGKAAKEAKIDRVAFVDEDHVVVETHQTADLTWYKNPGLAKFNFQKYQFRQVAILNLKTVKLSWVFGGEASILHNVAGVYGYGHKDGHSYGFYGGQMIDPTGITNEVDLFRVDLDSGQVVHVAIGGKEDFNYDWLVGPDGTVLAHVEYDKRSQQWRLIAEANHAVLASGRDRYFGPALLGLGRTPGAIVYDATDDDGVLHFYETALAPGAPQTPVFDGIGASDLTFDHATGLLDGAVIKADYPDVVFSDPTREARWKGLKAAFPEGYNVRLVAADDAFERLIVYTDAEGDAGTYLLIDLKTMNSQRFADAYPGVPANSVGPQKVIAYKAADGLELHGILTLPAGREAKGLPVIVFPHGGPQARDYLGFDWWVQAMASRGYAVFQPNFRGSSGYGADFVLAGNGEWGRKMQTDVSDGLKALADQGVVDPKRACIVGASYGGYVALAGVTIQHGLYRCAVAVAGVSDLRAMLADRAYRTEDPSVEDPEMRVWKDRMGAKSLSDGALHDISPADLADKADAPILLIHGKDDATVPIEQSRIMEAALKRAGKPVEFVQLDGEDHNLSREPTRVAMLNALVAFVEKYDPPN